MMLHSMPMSREEHFRVEECAGANQLSVHKLQVREDDLAWVEGWSLTHPFCRHWLRMMIIYYNII